jgi:hypothetical protein
MKNQAFFFIFLLVAVGCKQVQSSRPPGNITEELPFPNYETLSAEEQAQADTLLAQALDHEALYSLMGNLKPMSSIGFSLSYPLGKDSTQQDGQQAIVATQVDSIQMALAELKSWNRILDALSFDNYQFILVPFKQVWKGKRNLQILLCRTDLLDSLLVAQAPFFAQWGFVPGTAPEVLLTAIEFEERNDRYRAYGYLFGYPQHAVDFFVEASREEQKTGEFVKRSFFHIPVHARERGHFTYALPKNLQPLSQDSTTYYQAVDILERYRQIRPQFTNTQGELSAVALYRQWWLRKQKAMKMKP